MNLLQASDTPKLFYHKNIKELDHYRLTKIENDGFMKRQEDGM